MNSYKKGFTLIELMIVIAIIAILITIILESTSAAQATARNDRRSSDIQDVQLDLAQYYEAERSYPNPSDVSPIPAATNYATMLAALKSVLTDTGDLPTTDPTGKPYIYTGVNGAALNGTTYCLAIQMESGTQPSGNADCYTPGGLPTNWYSQLPPQ